MSQKPLITLVFMGHVDHGKSTLIGRTLFESGIISRYAMKKLEEETAKIGKEYAKFAWVMDRLRDERESDQTTDVSYSFFETKTKSFTIIDVPGHRGFAKNMIKGALQADASVIVVSAAPGQFEAGMKTSDLAKGEIGGQTLEHAVLAYSFGIRHLIIAVNKMDAVNFDQKRFEEIRGNVLSTLAEVGFANAGKFLFVPIAAYHGDNISRPCTKMLWYRGPTFLEALSMLEEAEKPVDKPLRIPIQRAFNVSGIGLVPVGRVETGIIKAGDEVIVNPSGVMGKVRSIEMLHRSLEKAVPGNNIGISIKGLKKEDVWKGCVIGHSKNPPTVTKRFKGKIVVIEHPTGISSGSRPVLFCHTEQMECLIEELVSRVDRRTGETISDRPELLRRGEVGIAVISTPKSIVIERAIDILRLSRFVLRDMGTTVATGICIEVMPS